MSGRILALELHEPDPAVRERLAKNFHAWIEAIAECLSQAQDRLPAGQHLREFAQFGFTAMEGGVMQARTFRDIEYFDASETTARQYFKHLETAGSKAAREKRARSPAKRTQREKPCVNYFACFCSHLASPSLSRIRATGRWHFSRVIVGRVRCPGGRTDEHCFTWVYNGKSLRDRHTVRAAGKPDALGESIYLWDSAAQRLEYLYIESDGGFSRGPVSIDKEALVFPDTSYVEKGKTMVYRSRWQRSGASAYDVVTEFKAGDGWVRGFRVHMELAGAPKPSRRRPITQPTPTHRRPGGCRPRQSMVLAQAATSAGTRVPDTNGPS